MPVIAERDVAKPYLSFELRRHAHLIATSTTAHRPALTTSAAPSLAATVIRRIDHGAGCAGCGVDGPWLWAWPWACPGVVVGMGVSHAEMLYYNITRVHWHARPQGFPIAIASAAARKGNGSDTAARNQTNRAGMNGISHKISRWKANSAQATT